MVEPEDPIGDRTFTDERVFAGDASWSLPRRLDHLALICKVQVLSSRTALRDDRRAERLTVRVRGKGSAIAKFWGRLDEAVAAYPPPPKRRRWLGWLWWVESAPSDW